MSLRIARPRRRALCQSLAPSWRVHFAAGNTNRRRHLVSVLVTGYRESGCKTAGTVKRPLVTVLRCARCANYCYPGSFDLPGKSD